MSGPAKQWLWALSWLATGGGCLLLGWRLNVPWLAGLAFLAVLAPFTPTSWRDDG